MRLSLLPRRILSVISDALRNTPVRDSTESASWSRSQGMSQGTSRTLDAGDSHARDDIRREPERDLLGDVECATLMTMLSVSFLWY